MSRADRPRRPRRDIVRAVLSIGILLGLPQVGTLASWTGTSTLTVGSISTGRLDLTVGETAADQLAGQGGSWNHASLALATMARGESVARTLVVKNSGTTPLTFNGTIASTGNDLYNAGSPGLQVTVVQGGTATNTGSLATANRTGTCSSTTATAITSHGVSTTPAALHATQQTLAAGASATYCVRVLLAPTAPAAMNGKSTTLTFALNAVQP